MCDMTVIVKENSGEETIITDVTGINISDDDVVIVSMFSDDVMLSHAKINHIDCLNNKIYICRYHVHKSSGASDTIIKKIQILIPHWIDHQRSHADELVKYATKIDGHDPIKDKLQDAAKHLGLAASIISEIGNDIAADGSMDESQHHHQHCQNLEGTPHHHDQTDM